MQPMPKRHPLNTTVRYIVLLVGVILLIGLTVSLVLNTRKRKAIEAQVAESKGREENLLSQVVELGKSLAECHAQVPQTTDMQRESPRREFSCRVICTSAGGKR